MAHARWASWICFEGLTSKRNRNSADRTPHTCIQRSMLSWKLLPMYERATRGTEHTDERGVQILLHATEGSAHAVHAARQPGRHRRMQRWRLVYTCRGAGRCASGCKPSHACHESHRMSPASAFGHCARSRGRTALQDVVYGMSRHACGARPILPLYDKKMRLLCLLQYELSARRQLPDVTFLHQWRPINT